MGGGGEGWGIERGVEEVKERGRKGLYVHVGIYGVCHKVHLIATHRPTRWVWPIKIMFGCSLLGIGLTGTKWTIRYPIMTQCYVPWIRYVLSVFSLVILCLFCLVCQIFTHIPFFFDMFMYVLWLWHFVHWQECIVNSYMCMCMSWCTCTYVCCVHAADHCALGAYTMNHEISVAK